MIKLNKQSGLSLVELMIALLIGSFLILGATQLYINSKRGQMFGSSNAENIENARFSTMVLEEQLSKAGFRRAPDQAIRTAFPAAVMAGCRNFPAGGALVPLANGNHGFCLRYQPATEDEVSCSGANVGVTRTPFTPSASNELVYVLIEFAEGTEQHDGSLNCTTRQGNVTSATEPIIEGVADFRVFMAEGEERERRLASPDYKAASAIGINAIVRAVSYEVLLASGPNRREGDSSVFTNYLAGLNAARGNQLRAKDQRHIYQVATGGQALRNLMP